MTGVFFVVMVLLLRLHLPVKAWLVSMIEVVTLPVTKRLHCYFLGNITALSFPLFTQQMYRRLGIPWANTLFAFIALVLMPIPFVSFVDNSVTGEMS